MSHVTIKRDDSIEQKFSAVQNYTLLSFLHVLRDTSFWPPIPHCILSTTTILYQSGGHWLLLLLLVILMVSWVIHWVSVGSDQDPLLSIMCFHLLAYHGCYIINNQRGGLKYDTNRGVIIDGSHLRIVSHMVSSQHGLGRWG